MNKCDDELHFIIIICNIDKYNIVSKEILDVVIIIDGIMFWAKAFGFVLWIVG